MTSQANNYAALSPSARLVAQVYGVVAPHPLSVARVARMLAQAEIRLLRRAMSEAEVRRCNREIVDAGIGFRPEGRTNAGICAAPDWAVSLTSEAVEAKHLGRILNAFENTRRHIGADVHIYEMLFRCYVVAGDFRNLDGLIGNEASVDEWRFLAAPLAVDVLARLPARHIDSALAGCLRHAADTASPPEPVIDACRRFASGPEVHAGDIAFVHVLKGDFDAAEKVFAALPEAVRERKPATIGRAATRALTAMLRGDDVAARRFIDESIAAEKAGTRRRQVFPDSSAFTLSLLSLVRVDTAESQTLLTQLLRASDRHVPDRHEEVAFVYDALCAQSEKAVYMRGADRPCFDVLRDGLRHCWIAGDRPHRRYDWQPVMEAYRARAARNGYAWIAAECAAILKRIGVPAPDADALHTALGTRPLVDLALPIPAWERSLRALELMAYTAMSNQGKSRKTKTEPRKRLVWDLVEVDLGFQLNPREQRETRSGTWTKGRRVALKRLAADAATMDFLREEDRAAAAAIKVHRYWGTMEYVLGRSGVYALAGHPHVFNDDGDSVEIVRRDPELRIDESADGDAIVVVDPHGWNSDDEYGIVRVSSRRYEVTRFSAEHQRLFDHIPPDGLVVPPDAKPRLLEAVSGLVSQVRVQSAAGAVQAIAEVAADAEPWVRLEPFDAGLTIALVVEPIADSGIFFEPGRGGGTVFASRDGENVQAQRDLVAEKQAVAALVDACPGLLSRPTEYEPLTLPEPIACLELLEQLEVAGARCKWPKGEPFRIVARRSTASLSLSLRTADQWLEASAKLAVDDETVLDLRRLFEMLEASPGNRFLELGDGQFVALTTAFRRQLEDLKSLSAPAAGGAMRLHAFAASSLDDLFEEADVDQDEGLADLRDRLEAARSVEPSVPNTLQAELRPYQVDGYRWLARLGSWGAGACLADDMGLGKTVQTLTALLERAPDGPALVVAPTSVVANWIDEARRFAPTLNVKLYTGSATARAPLLDDPQPFDLYLTTYGLLQNDIARLADIHWHSAVLDEAQAIKNPTAKRARAAKRLRADFRIITTGTPIQNNLMDLHSLFGFLNPGLLGSQERFRTNFAEAIEREEDFDARSRLRRIVAPFILRRLKADVLDDLPERTEITLHVTLSAAEAALYETLRQRAVREMAGVETEAMNPGERGFALLAHLTRLRLACCNPRLVSGGGELASKSAKLETFAATLDELLQNRHKVLVFSQFVRHLKLVEEYLNETGISYQYLDGSTPAKARTERIAAFQSGEGDVFLISLKAGGVGLNLTAADYVIHMDPWWNPAVEDQASDRAHRIGQTRPVTIYRLVAEGTIEEQIVDLHRHKRHLAEQLLEGTDAPGRLSTDELLELLREPVGGS